MEEGSPWAKPWLAGDFSRLGFHFPHLSCEVAVSPRLPPEAVRAKLTLRGLAPHMRWETRERDNGGENTDCCGILPPGTLCPLLFERSLEAAFSLVEVKL